MQPLADVHVADLNTVRCDCPLGSWPSTVERAWTRCLSGPHPEPFYKQSSHTYREAGQSGRLLRLPSPTETSADPMLLARPFSFSC